MLPAVTAELPAYLVPPTVNTNAKSTSSTQDFGPDATLEISAEARSAAQSQHPGVGLYGPDGHFVETTSHAHQPHDPPTQPTHTPEQPPAPPTDESARAARLRQQQEEQQRELSLSQIDAAVPPAQRAELRDLARRVQRRNGQETLQARDYKQIANLMQRVGEFKEAEQALQKARELEEGPSAESAQSESAPQ